MVAFLVGIAAYFALHTLYLATLPLLALHAVDGAEWASGLVIVAYMGAAAALDIPAGRCVVLWGARSVILAGSLGMAAGTIGLWFADQVGTVFAMSAVLGAATSCMLGPLLSGFSSQAGERQERAQLINAAVQRGGALLISFLIAPLLAAKDGRVGIATALGLCVVIAVLSRFLHPRGPADSREPLPRIRAGSQPPTAPVGAFRLAASSSSVQKSLVVNGLLPLLLIFAASFFPLAAISSGAWTPGVTALALAAREGVAVLAALLLLPLVKRINVESLFLTTLVLSVSTLMITAVVPNVGAAVALFAVHGTALSVSIFAANVHMYRGTDMANRPIGYSLAMATVRVASVSYPILLLPSARSLQALLLTVSLITLIMGMLYWLIGLRGSRNGVS